jgi:hypothetical protein
MMTKPECLLHLFKLTNHFKFTAHPQLVSRFVLESLRIDERIDASVYAEVDEVVKTNSLLEHDKIWFHYLAQIEALRKANEPPEAPKVTKIHVSIRPRPRRY